jgi:hypothetical protein
MMGTVVHPTYVYVTPPNTEPRKLREQKTHLVDQADLATSLAPRTLCGWRIHPEWIRGDETQAGLATTCRSCKRNLRTG